MMVLDFIQSKLFSNYQPPKPFTPPRYRPPVGEPPETNNQASQQGNQQGGGGAPMSSQKINPFRLDSVQAPSPTEAPTTTPIATLGGISGVTRPEAVLSKTITGNNPFLLAQTDPAKQLEQLGQNIPFPRPIFLGYRDNKALYGASKLFVLC
jgi:hypothetical protein